jgi:hypothetical protein
MLVSRGSKGLVRKFASTTSPSCNFYRISRRKSINEERIAKKKGVYESRGVCHNLSLPPLGQG